MLQGAPATNRKQVEQDAIYVQSLLGKSAIFSYGAEPEMQVDFHIPCDEAHPHVAQTLCALIPCASQTHQASAFNAGEYVQLSLHKEQSVEEAEAFLADALSRTQSDAKLAAQIVQQIEKNHEAEQKRIAARKARIEALKAKVV